MDKKRDQLGMPFGTASARLKKNMLLHMLQRLNEDKCYRCGLKIETPDELSLDHKEPWLDNSTDLFWDLDNISFSHPTCNTNARRIKKILPPTGKVWCWDCKQYCVLAEFPLSKRKNRIGQCTSCYSRYRQKHRKTTGKR